jgi:cob(I)alamin adenosyltransferase
MSKRITRVTTRSGDGGQTHLADGSALSKTDARIGALGDIDELNSFVGVLITHLERADLQTLCLEIQQELFDLGAHIATIGQVPAPLPERLEKELKALNSTLPPLAEFVLPGGSAASANAHVCRAVCRRAERTAWRAETTPAAVYLNRLSDLFFVMARIVNQSSEEAQWRGSSKPKA